MKAVLDFFFLLMIGTFIYSRQKKTKSRSRDELIRLKNTTKTTSTKRKKN